MKFKKIGIRMLAFILPVIIAAMLVLTVISAVSSKNIIQEQIANHMASELNAQNGEIEGYLNVISATAENVAASVSTTYKTTDLTTYENMLTSIISSNDMILGSGIWFEPYVYDPSEEYIGPYVFKDGDKITTTYSYSNADYDYFNQEYYLNSKESGKAVITDPYYDESSGLIMSSCSMPMYDNDKFIGCVTVDVSLDAIQKLVDAIAVGDEGSAILLTSEGVYLGGVDAEKVESGASITEDDNKSFANAGTTMLANDSGITTYTAKGKNYNLYYATISGVNWTLIIQMPQSELNAPVDHLIRRLLLVCLLAILFSMAMIIIQVRSISKSVSLVQLFATSLADGDFTIDNLKITTEDELGNMGRSLNNMYESNRNVINNIAHHAVNIDESSTKLQDAAKNLSEEFKKIQEHMANVNEAMMSTSAATQQVNASTEEVNSNVNILADETETSMTMAKSIRERATEVGQSSQASYDTATELSGQFEKRLAVSIENAKVVENIGSMASVISEIAEQINLLSLNASIEAARAGEQGKGFAVVASEIGKLAHDTSQAVSQIQDTISDVNNAFGDLTTDAHGLLDFIQTTVTPDYNNFVNVAGQYGEDAVSIESTSNKLSEMSANIRSIMQEVTDAIQSIAESAQSTADISSEIMNAVTEVATVVGQVSDMSDQQDAIAEQLTDVVSNFKLKNTESDSE